MENNNEGLNVTIDLAQALSSHMTKGFMQESVTKAIKDNPKIIAEQIQLFVLQDILKSELYENIKVRIKSSLEDYLKEDVFKDYTYKGARDTLVREAVADQKQNISKVIASKIQGDDFKERVSFNISQGVRERVMVALGEVCEGCERDMY